jgi:hypothetical protein
MQPTEMIPCGLRFCVSILANTKQYILNFINIWFSKLALCDVIIATGRLKNRLLCFVGGVLQKLWRRSCSKLLDKTAGEPYFANNGRNVRV